ncbi:DNA endonuclease RBBP8 [Scleropages formosus]|uniref:DNA endonuclease RBBP8 n=2 Tax=Scleropages formosus TaxID=113540 RepID=A0A8C9S419_SCLFO|nr:DNA endonuclease RBBP8 [Scleropages formosus]XP_018620895.2 DNA endonuclease RBBP8 [Scleropages formosus]XP_018620897.2 DNA endonuclease RBBP8 [Scleropages formosus]XP_018620898.2 DNA endonuclease RBBP8 [Scleropages formosus]XP_018620899.2 DNA endonuclease RBBP8 [Scleropages formosus]
MNSSAVNIGSPGSGMAPEVPCDLFKELWMRLKECHDDEVQSLQGKINKLKKERCLDAQRLEEFYSKNQQLREHQKVLQENVKVLEDRLRAGLCDRCAVTEEHMKKKQVEFEKVRQQNLRLITELMNEKNSLQDENKKLNQELEHLRTSESRKVRVTIPDAEEGIIPDSPVRQASMPLVNKMRRRKDGRHVRYAENPGLVSQMSILIEEHREGDYTETVTGHDKSVLVPETCEMDESLRTKVHGKFGRPGMSVVAETCGLDLPEEESQSVLDSVTTSELIEDNAIQKTGSMKGNERSSRHFSTSPDSSSNLECSQHLKTSRSLNLVKLQESKINGSPSVLQDINPNNLEHLRAEVISHTSPFKISLLSRLCLQNNEKLQGPLGQDQTVTKNGFVCKNRMDSKNGEINDLVDKPLDLSDHLPGISLIEKPGALSKDKMKQATVVEKGQEKSLLSVLKVYNGSEPSDYQEDPNLKDGCHSSSKQSKHSPSFKMPSTPPRAKTITQQLFDVLVPEIQEPVRKKLRTKKDSETAVVLQSKFCSRMKNTPPHELDDKQSLMVDQTWSVDPGANLSQYMTNCPPQTKQGAPTSEDETVDTDCTFVSHSILLKSTKQNMDSTCLGVGQKANDSLADIFDRMTYGEYESCPQVEELELEHKEQEEEMEECVDTANERLTVPPNQVKSHVNNSDRRKASFPHVEVVRKKEERKKLKGHTCKECEIYYAGLSEEERQKKLSACSRHRFRYIPPSTPENFWEVGFPSTQTCVERGYIKEDAKPHQRVRRRRPYNAIFSPKGKEQTT